MNSRSALVAALSLSTAFAAVANASVARAVSFDQKIREADEIVLGKCTKSYSAFDPTGKWIVTYSTFDVEEDLKGSGRAEVTVVTPGGTVGGLHQETIGIPKFEAGDEKLLFVKKIDAGETVLYADQGTYDTVREDGALKIAPTASKLVLVDERTGAVRTDREPVRSLDQFRRQVRDTLNRVAENTKPTEAGTMKRGELSSDEASMSKLMRFVTENKIAVGMLLAGVILSAIPLLLRRR